MKITIEDLNKVYANGNQALKDINLVIENGMFGLLGPNGAGKSTLMRILVTLMKPTSGRVRVNDWDLQKDRRHIRTLLGYLPQEFRFFSKLKTWEFLDYSAGLAGMKNRKVRIRQVDELLDQVGLYEVRERQANKLSGGMKRRLGIAQALVGDPRIVVVDEPTTGLDPEERIRFRNLLSKMSQKDIIILLSTHIVGDISSTCKNMALLNDGLVVFHGPPEELINIARDHVFRIRAERSDFEAIKERFPVISTIPSEEGWEIQVVADSIDGFRAETVHPNLEDGYVYFMEFRLGVQTGV